MQKIYNKVIHNFSTAWINYAYRQNVVEKMLKDLCSWKNSVNQKIIKFLSDKVISNDNKEKLFNLINQHLNFDQSTCNFFYFVLNHGRIQYWNDIVEYTLDLYNKKNKIIDVQLFTPIVCTEEYLNKMKQLLMSKFDFKEINIKNIVDESIIGGYLIRFDDIQIDNSISSKIKNMKNEVHTIFY